jgi:hypothetical protein
MDRVRIFFGFGSESVESTGAWPGMVLAVVTGVWPGVSRAWPGPFTSTAFRKLDIASSHQNISSITSLVLASARKVVASARRKFFALSFFVDETKNIISEYRGTNRQSPKSTRGRLDYKKNQKGLRQNAYGRRERNDHRQYGCKDETKSNAASAATAMRWGMARVSNRGMARVNKGMARQINIKSPLPLPDKAATAKTTTWHGATIKEGGMRGLARGACLAVCQPSIRTGEWAGRWGGSN